MLAESFELGALLRHERTYKLIDSVDRLQVATTTRMVQEHVEQQVIERVVDNGLASDDEPKLQ